MIADRQDEQTPQTAPRRGNMSLQAKVAVIAVAVVALTALFWPRGGNSFEAPGGFLFDPDGRPTTLGERLAPVTLLHFWATWCPPCITEIPSLYQLGESIQSEDFAIVMVAVENEVAQVEEFLGNRAATALYDPNWEVAHRYGTRKLPETYLLVGRNVVERFIGPQNWNDPALRQYLAEKVREHRPGIQLFAAGS